MLGGWWFGGLVVWWFGGLVVWCFGRISVCGEFDCFGCCCNAATP
jgi:transposase